VEAILARNEYTVGNIFDTGIGFEPGVKERGSYKYNTNTKPIFNAPISPSDITGIRGARGDCTLLGVISIKKFA